MFTGLIEEVGRLVSSRPRMGMTLLEIEAPGMAPHLRFGQSVAVSGACLTVVEEGETRFSVEMMAETVQRTRLGALRPGARLNLERALSLQARLDGHIVQGHVDSVGTVRRMDRNGLLSVRLWVDLEERPLVEVIPKGSVAIDGVSLTVIDVDARGFSVGLIPTTQKETTLADLAIGHKVNIETDVLAKYVRRMLGVRNSEGESQVPVPLTEETLRELGWLS